MKAQLEERLIKLKNEHAKGLKLLINIEEKETELKRNMLRISGAVQILEEELGKIKDDKSDGDVVKMKSNKNESIEKIEVG